MKSTLTQVLKTMAAGKTLAAEVVVVPTRLDHPEMAVLPSLETKRRSNPLVKVRVAAITVDAVEEAVVAAVTTAEVVVKTTEVVKTAEVATTAEEVEIMVATMVKPALMVQTDMMEVTTAHTVITAEMAVTTVEVAARVAAEVAVAAVMVVVVAVVAVLLPSMTLALTTHSVTTRV